MAELLLELLSEEIPARMQARAAEDLKRLVTEKLKAAGLAFRRAESYVTPRRLALMVDGLPARQPNRREERKGPREGAPEQAVQGFLKASGLESIAEAELRESDKGKFYFAVREIAGRPTIDLLPALVADTVAALAWPKSMRWGSGTLRYVRPLQSLLCLFDGKAVTGALALGEGDSLPFGSETRGHRFLAPAPFAVSSFADYRRKLEAAHVILDPAVRRERIALQSEALARAHGLTVKEDPALLDEVVGLVEWPVVLLGRIDRQFMELPAEVLTTAMRSHQKYFALLDAKGALADRFLLVANMETADGGKTVVAGNERVLRARLSDARFFWDQDRKVPLASRAPRLADIVFHAKLGTLDEKIDRVQALAAAIARQVPGANLDRVRSAARLAKADLVTGMVGEFPELQGIIGRYYALHDGEHEEVAEAIAEHYSPLGPNDRCPSAPVSVAVALADKLDTLAGFWAIGEKPTGSKDPYALRRAALGVIRLILENKLRLSLTEMLTAALDNHKGRITVKDRSALAADLLDFFAERLKVALRERGVRHDLISAVFAVKRQDGAVEDDLSRLIARVEALAAFLSSDDGANLLTAYRRAANIVRIEEKKDKASYDGAVEEGRLVAKEEKALSAALAKAAKTAGPALEGEDFTAAMGALAGLRRPVDEFFDKVTVNSEDKALRANRLRVLAAIDATLRKVADFSKIEG